MKILIASTLSLALLAGASAFAQPSQTKPAEAKPAAAQTARTAPGHDKAAFIATNDANGDSIVTRVEFDAARAAHYALFDANKDGKVSEEEYIAEYQVRLEKEIAEMRERQLKQAHVRFGVLDSNKNKDLAAAEFNASGTRMFGELDTNKDGKVDERDTAEQY